MNGAGRAEIDFSEWQASVPATITKDALWRVEVYRLALFVADLSWSEVTTLSRDSRTRGLAGQLYESVCSIAANISEGYSRGTGRDRARFYEYALGSAREARGWYYKARHLLGDEVANRRLDIIASIIRMLLVVIPDQRGTGIREETSIYAASEA